MKNILTISTLVILGFTSASAYFNFSNSTNKLGICSYSATCSAGGNEGVCVSISSGCCAGGSDTAGLCPGDSDIRCCTAPTCSTPAGSGTCLQTSSCSSQGGKSYSGYCAGPSDLQCCVKENKTCDYSATCSAGGVTGTCVSISSGCCGTGIVTSGLCPGDSDIKCCTQAKCNTPSGSGMCMQTSACSSSGGHSVGGYCTGPSDLQCCIDGAPPPPPAGNYGVDVSTTITGSSASCFVSSGLSFVVPRGYCSDGTVDHRVCDSIVAAAQNGIKIRDTYFFPCPTCGKSASTQMSELLAHLNANCQGFWSGRVWMDIEGSQYWTGDYGANQAWYKSLINTCSEFGVSCGIYASASQWTAIFGDRNFVYGNNLPLWYAHYDGQPSFDDFSAFGGWSSPHAKQYDGTSTVCGMGVDKNYSPSF